MYDHSADKKTDRFSIKKPLSEFEFNLLPIYIQNNKEKFNVYCKGKFSLTFQSPIIYEPQKMGFKICYNDVLKLKQSTCFIDKIVPVEKKEMFQKEKP